MPMTILAILGGLLIVGLTPYDTFGWVLFGLGVAFTLLQLVVLAKFLKYFRGEWKKF